MAHRPRDPCRRPRAAALAVFAPEEAPARCAGSSPALPAAAAVEEVQSLLAGLATLALPLLRATGGTATSLN